VFADQFCLAAGLGVVHSLVGRVGQCSWMPRRSLSDSSRPDQRRGLIVDALAGAIGGSARRTPDPGLRGRLIGAQVSRAPYRTGTISSNNIFSIFRGPVQNRASSRQAQKGNMPSTFIRVTQAAIGRGQGAVSACQPSVRALMIEDCQRPVWRSGNAELAAGLSALRVFVPCAWQR